MEGSPGMPRYALVAWTVAGAAVRSHEQPRLNRRFGDRTGRA